jgi:hypothetical protein
MTTDFLATVHDYLTLAQAAQRLSDVTTKTVTEAEVYGLVLHGDLKLSVYLPTAVGADCWEVWDPRAEDSMSQVELHEEGTKIWWTVAEGRDGLDRTDYFAEPVRNFVCGA